MVTYDSEGETFSLNPQEAQRAAFGFSGGRLVGSEVGRRFFAAYTGFESRKYAAGISNNLFANEHAAALGIDLSMEATRKNVSAVQEAIDAWKAAYPDEVLAIDGIRHTPYFEEYTQQAESAENTIAVLNDILLVIPQAD